MRKRMRVRVMSQIAATLRLWEDFSTSILSRLGVGPMQSEEAMLEEIGKMQGSGGALRDVGDAIYRGDSYGDGLERL